MVVTSTDKIQSLLELLNELIKEVTSGLKGTFRGDFLRASFCIKHISPRPLFHALGFEFAKIFKFKIDRKLSPESPRVLYIVDPSLDLVFLWSF
jgi:hypothetical protein